MEQLKDLINWLAEPIRSFPIVTIIFFLMLKFYRQIGTKAFAWWSLILSLPVTLFFVLDKEFIKIILWPDNVPIIILMAVVVWSTWYAMYRGSLNDARLEKGECPIEALPENREKVWCWPNLVYTELFAIIACTILLIVWAIIFKAPLEEPANPTWAPNPAKAPWYFLGLQEMLVYFDPWMAGVVLPGIVVVGLIAIPYIDTNPKGNGYYTFDERPMAISLFLYGWLVLWIFLIVIGVFLRGPNWTFYGPFEYWDFHKVEAAYNVNLSEYFWIKMLGKPFPKNIIVREWLGIFVTIVYIGVLPWLSYYTKTGKELLSKLGHVRYLILVFLFLGMTSLPIKMFLRWIIDLKYIIAMPEFELNL